MKKYCLFLALFFTFCACNENRGGEKDPSVMQPPSEDIPDSIKIVNDSVITPETTPGNGSQVGRSDSIRRNR
ncbi:MAG: hypothetical protein ICV79_27385 [Flavisolibacter sp.]|nr:hypothetical protein [Flavisolibacter sp.]